MSSSSSSSKSCKPLPSRTSVSSDEFVGAVSRAATAHIATEVGFTRGCQRPALHTLAEVAIKYMSELARTMAQSAGSARRTDVNFSDACCAVNSLGHTDMRRLRQFHQFSADMPLPKAIPSFSTKSLPVHLVGPVLRSSKPDSSSSSSSSSRPAKSPHIPDFLPSLPDAHTHQHTPVFADRLTDRNRVRESKLQQKRALESSLVKLQKAAVGAQGDVLPANFRALNNAGAPSSALTNVGGAIGQSAPKSFAITDSAVTHTVEIPARVVAPLRKRGVFESSSQQVGTKKRKIGFSLDPNATAPQQESTQQGHTSKKRKVSPSAGSGRVI